MDDALGVRRLERIGDLNRRLHERTHVEPPGDQLGQRLPLEQLHHDEVLAIVLVDRVDGADARMVKSGGGPRLALKPLERLRISAELGRQKLQRHAAAEPRVLGFVDDTHAAGAEGPENVVVGHARSNHEFTRIDDLCRRRASDLRTLVQARAVAVLDFLVKNHRMDDTRVRAMEVGKTLETKD
jgi:hypothetical protein